MRVIGGKLKNKKINFPKNIKTRPLKDNVRENIFNILMHSNIININFEGLNVLDLYAGSGSFGIECLSRGASNVIFVEKDLDALFNLKKNINNINLSKNSKIISKDINLFFNAITLKDNKKCITIVLCARGYPGEYVKDKEIKNLSKIHLDKNNQIFHAGTYEVDGKIFSKGGRVLNITSSSDDLREARNSSLSNLKEIDWDSGFFRKDIGWRAIKKK